METLGSALLSAATTMAMADVPGPYQEMQRARCGWSMCNQELAGASEAELVDNVVKHCLSQHGQEYISRSGERHECKWVGCKRFFKSGSHSFKMHIRRDFCRWYRLQPHACQHCSIRFVAKQDLNRHEAYKHQNVVIKKTLPTPKHQKISITSTGELSKSDRRSLTSLNTFLVALSTTFNFSVKHAIDTFMPDYQKVLDNLSANALSQQTTTESPKVSNAVSDDVATVTADNTVPATSPVHEESLDMMGVFDFQPSYLDTSSISDKLSSLQKVVPEDPPFQAYVYQQQQQQQEGVCDNVPLAGHAINHMFLDASVPTVEAHGVPDSNPSVGQLPNYFGEDVVQVPLNLPC